MAGAACVLGFAPFGAWPVPIVALAALFAVWARSASPLQAALSGYAFGIAFFLAGVSWVFVSLHFYGEMPAALAALATFLFCAFLALLPALAGWLTVRVAGASVSSRLWLAPAAFVACEWVRGWIFTGFPWIDLGTSQVPASPLAGFAPWLGAYGVSLAVAGAAALATALAFSFALSRARVAADRRHRGALRPRRHGIHGAVDAARGARAHRRAAAGQRAPGAQVARRDAAWRPSPSIAA